MALRKCSKDSFHSLLGHTTGVGAVSAEDIDGLKVTGDEWEWRAS